MHNRFSFDRLAIVLLVVVALLVGACALIYNLKIVDIVHEHDVESTSSVTDAVVSDPSSPADNPESWTDSWAHYDVGACPTEDSDNCYWDASEMGDGTGSDFVTLNGVTYYPPAPTWHDFTVGEVLVCDDGTVETDTYEPGDDPAMPHGGTWAHCA